MRLLVLCATLLLCDSLTSDCVDDITWFVKSKPAKDCEWVASDTEKYCKDSPSVESSDGVSPLTACARTCGCPLGTNLNVLSQAGTDSTCYNLLNQRWTLAMDYKTTGMHATAMLVDVPAGLGFKPYQHYHCGLHEVWLAIKPEDDALPGSQGAAEWQYEDAGTVHRYPGVSDGDVGVMTLGRMHSYFNYADGAAANAGEIPTLDPVFLTRHLVIKLHGDSHQLRAERTGVVRGACTPHYPLEAYSATAKSALTEYDLGDPKFIFPTSSLGDPASPVEADAAFVHVARTAVMYDEEARALCPGMSDVVDAEVKASTDYLSLATCTLEYSDESSGTYLPDATFTTFFFVTSGTIELTVGGTGGTTKTVSDLDGATLPPGSDAYSLRCTTLSCVVNLADIDSQYDIASLPNYGVDASSLVHVSQSDYGKTDYDTYQKCHGEYTGNIYSAGRTSSDGTTTLLPVVDVTVDYDWWTAAPL